MARYIGPVCKLCRREQMKLFLKGDKCFTRCVLEKRGTPPGMARPQRGKMSEYAVRLREKQKLRRMVSMTERPFEHLFRKASKATGKTGEALLQYLEFRLDNIVRRLGFCMSLKTARQMVLHGHVRVNGQVLNIPSFGLKPGDHVSLDPALKENLAVKLGLEAADKKGIRPSFLEFNAQELTGKLLRMPAREEISFPVQEQLVVEYYSK
ncbi:MAG: 30S ribosomal protein S4 [Elusimicrobia bacterium]|nr:30S ribosomal protein S4 [Elusimicrobiota bacterium]